MDINQKLKTSLLLEIYGKLLTDKQYNYVDFFVNDMSFSEIAENYNISSQAAFDLVSRTIKVLEEYEDKLQLLNKFNNIKEQINCIVNEIQNNADKDGIIKKLNEILDIL